jgi:type II restriction/modification system DNA methylase subunit YeeA
MLEEPNPDGRSNREVVRPWVNGLDITRRARDMWIIDFGTSMRIEEAALYERPFEYVKQRVMPTRSTNRRSSYAERWWLHVEPRSGMRESLAGLSRFLATPNVTKHRLFVWLPKETLPDHQLIVFSRDDDYFFGVLHSCVHELWALRLGTQLETRPRYTPTTTFETFPFPEHPTSEAVGEVEATAHSLSDLRAGWLDPPGASEDELRRRTLTNLYNQRPSWLDQAHERLDRAVHLAYGWPFPLENGEVLARLVVMNLARGGGTEQPNAKGGWRARHEAADPGGVAESRQRL